LRLVRFNIISNDSKGNEELMAANRKNFTGLPIPAAAAAAVSANLFLVSNEFRSLFSISEEAKALILMAVLLVLGFFMISRWKFPSINGLRIRVRSFRLVFLIVLFAVFIFYGMLHHFPVVFMLLSWSYILVAWSLSLIRLISGQKLKTLEDFELDPDEMEDDDH
jgi:CDP-diacylglycerol--serine O-phosphatidyltransferase